MSWEAIAAIASATGVIASLLYLATQVRQNNRASAVAADRKGPLRKAVCNVHRR